MLRWAVVTAALNNPIPVFFSVIHILATFHLHVSITPERENNYKTSHKSTKALRKQQETMEKTRANARII